MATLPSFAKLQAEYFDYVHYTSAQVLQAIGGKVQINAFANTCAVRMSRALNYNSIPLPGPSSSGSMSVVSGADKKWYAFRVRDLSPWMSRKLTKPNFEISKKQGDPFDKTTISKLRGIIGFDIHFDDATGHLDLWDGTFFTSEKAGHLSTDYWQAATRIWIWTA